MELFEIIKQTLFLFLSGILVLFFCSYIVYKIRIRKRAPRIPAKQPLRTHNSSYEEFRKPKSIGLNHARGKSLIKKFTVLNHSVEQPLKYSILNDLLETDTRKQLYKEDRLKTYKRMVRIQTNGE